MQPLLFTFACDNSKHILNTSCTPLYRATGTFLNKLQHEVGTVEISHCLLNSGLVGNVWLKSYKDFKFEMYWRKICICI